MIVTARKLARANPQKPRQADLKRAVSTAYYAMFSALARECADRFIGVGKARSEGAWTQVYRALEHGIAKNGSKQAQALGFPNDVVTFADVFVTLQEERHRADYDPDVRFTRAQCDLLILSAEQAIAGLKQAKMRDRRAFAALVLFKRR